MVGTEARSNQMPAATTLNRVLIEPPPAQGPIRLSHVHPDRRSSVSGSQPRTSTSADLVLETVVHRFGFRPYHDDPVVDIRDVRRVHRGTLCRLTLVPGSDVARQRDR